ncbi:MAG: SUMF1/EgtB/PvdO family nonheme iron enzyme [Thermosynechococcaceae cyanobacterium]
MPSSQTLSLMDLKIEIRQRYEQTRSQTLHLFETLDSDLLNRQAHPDFSPVGWHLGHIGFTEGLWLLEQASEQEPLFPEYRRLFAADGLPKELRQQLPSFAEICDYLSEIRRQVFDALEYAPIEKQGWLWLWLLQHESQHCETITWVLNLHQLKAARTSHIQLQPLEDRFPRALGEAPRTTTLQQAILQRCQSDVQQITTDMVRISAGPFVCGNDGLEALDNEKPAHIVDLDTYWIDRTPVTCGDYLQFMEAGGYTHRQWWSERGWAWLQDHPVSHPLYWALATEGADQLAHPVCGVSWFEADAYARFVGKRLPTEAEWEKAASWDPQQQCRRTYPWGESYPSHLLCNFGGEQGKTTPVDQYPRGQSAMGCFDLIGNVWEWTETWFHPYEGYISFPYEGYSQAYFDDQHRVLKGGSWATQAPVLRGAFRNWYYPQTRQHFAGFRCAYS